MTRFERTMFAEEGDDAGIFMDGLAGALTTWAAMQMRTVTVLEAAMVFNTTPAVICEAVKDGPWIYEINGVLELDGA